MKRFFFLEFLFLSQAVAGELSHDPSCLNLDECLKRAQSNSYRIEASKAEVDLAIASKHEALSNLLPHVQLEGRYELKNSQRDYSVFKDFGSAFSSRTVGVTANLLLFDFFSAWNFYRAGQYGVLASEKNLEKTRAFLDEEVKTSYFRVLETKKAIYVVEDSIRSWSSNSKRTGITLIKGLYRRPMC